MPALMTLCGGFLLAVLWFDLMFDVQVLGRPAGPLSEDVLASISGYYHRVTTTARPMGDLVGTVMLILIGGTIHQLVTRSIPRLLAAVALAFALPPIALAGLRVVPNAIRLGGRADSIPVQSELARSICYEHLACLASIAAFCGIQLYALRAAVRTTDGSAIPRAAYAATDRDSS